MNLESIRTSDLLEELARRDFAAERARLQPSVWIEHVSMRTGLTPEEISTGGRGTSQLSSIRFITAWGLRDFCRLTLPEIALVLDLADHTSAAHRIARHLQLMSGSPDHQRLTASILLHL
ncbi:chromosomal replication initiation ATPase DnaA [Haloferula luteola]|uniref:Chromosomal replication initiation ATPase DnaA n=1 Tax=Haloferula luteola TaxID=595692 RepID=A0A840UZ88_9BACT|nr:hypothetical protein [Haloferula luteola]MBB5351092.1 chromosomal replication initiation ATPase DnaA [Haloferula luteola]